MGTGTNPVPTFFRLLTAVILVATAANAQARRDLKVETGPIAPIDGKSRWAVIIGISQFKNVAPQFQLRYADRDAKSFAAFLRSPEGGNVPPSHTRLLTDTAATAAAIRSTLHDWLPSVAGPNDIVYVYFAGHGVLDNRNQGYFVAHDSDPQNLHATAVSFAEVNANLTSRTRAGAVVLLMDACHAGSIGWIASPVPATRTQAALEQIGAQDRTMLKILASRPSESSYEDAKWDGGHGIFTHALLRGLQGEAETQRDGIVRASELVDFLSRLVPAQTSQKQNPRVAGNFEPSLPLSVLSPAARLQSGAGKLLLRGPAGAAAYIDDVFRGGIRPNGELQIEALSAGPHRLTVEAEAVLLYEGQIALSSPNTTLDITGTPEFAVSQLRSRLQKGPLLGKSGAWEFYRSSTFPPGAQVLITTALEEAGQQCVNDYVQSTTPGLKRKMLLEAVDALTLLETLRPNDSALKVKRTFCTGRAQIASGQFQEAVASLQAAIAMDPDFACAYNALGVALAQLGRRSEAREAFVKAGQITPEWGLPYLQLGQIALNASDAAAALPYLEKAVALNPRSVLSRWHLMRTYRLLRRTNDFQKLAASTRELDANYAPQYLEAGLQAEAEGNFPAAAQAYDTYVTLAPNFGDTLQVRQKAQQAREAAAQGKLRGKPSLVKK